ncbi:hypothetical protein B296_00045496 [Ensete ventricosum]|uniref:DUF834 domain-containing protein n=1 Tax=Ensete ventricosum TaxID=4639 RepID=A0A426X9F3_ENSVE|nr:hypothetical protein B296_00045496 [Ensete ventricosum]
MKLQREATRRGRKGTMAVDGYVAVGGDIINHDNVADRGRRGQQRGDVGEGDLGGRGGKDSGGKKGQRLLQRVMARLGAAMVASAEERFGVGSGVRRGRGSRGVAGSGEQWGPTRKRKQGSKKEDAETRLSAGSEGRKVRMGATATEEGAAAVDAGAVAIVWQRRGLQAEASNSGGRKMRQRLVGGRKKVAGQWLWQGRK